MGKLRKAWREHLALDDQALALVMRTLGITLRLESGEELRERLNDRFSSSSPFIDDTMAFWQPRSKRTLSREDAREIIENVAGFLSILQEWDKAEREVDTKSGAPSPADDTKPASSA